MRREKVKIKENDSKYDLGTSYAYAYRNRRKISKKNNIRLINSCHVMELNEENKSQHNVFEISSDFDIEKSIFDIDEFTDSDYIECHHTNCKADLKIVCNISTWNRKLLDTAIKRCKDEKKKTGN